MVPGLGVEPRRARGPRDFKATGERQRIKDLGNSLPFPVSEESEEGRRVRGLWTPRWTPVFGLHGLLEGHLPAALQGTSREPDDPKRCCHRRWGKTAPAPRAVLPTPINEATGTPREALLTRTAAVPRPQSGRPWG